MHTIPVTVLTGFLGSGKTTLLNKILSENHGKKIAVIENEFGEIGVDNELVIGADEEIFEMNNGCLCCTVRGDLIRVLGQLLKRKDKFDYILIETTGMANPAPVAQTFWMDEEMREQFALDAIVTVVDAKHIMLHLDESEECQQQIGFADVILLNKCDLVTTADLDLLEKRIKHINSNAKVYRTINAAIEMDKILNIKAFDLDAKGELNPQFLIEEYPFEAMQVFELNEQEYEMHAGCHEHDHHNHAHDHGHQHKHDHHHHSHGPVKFYGMPLQFLNDADLDKFKKAAIKGFADKPQLRKEKAFLNINECMNELQANDHATFRLKVNKPGLYAVFFEHNPKENHIHFIQNGQVVKPLLEREFEHSHSHEDEVSSVGIVEEGEVDMQKLQDWVDYITQVKGPSLYRYKGILNVKGQEERFVFQGVHMLFDAKADRKWYSNEKRMNQLVFIGKDLNREELNKSFRACLSKTQSLKVY